MLPILRVLFGAALLYELFQGVRAAPGAMGAGDTTGAFYLAVCVGLGLLNAFVWAPYFGSKIAGPLAGMMTEGHYVERVNWVARFMRWLENLQWRRLTLFLAFFEGVRHPSSPTPFVVGMRNAKPGSWLEKVFAREVFRFNNTQNCVQAYLALRRHGIDPRPHPSQEISIVLLSLDREPRPEPTILAVPKAEKPAALKRNPRIRLFKGSSNTGVPEVTKTEVATATQQRDSGVSEIAAEQSVESAPASDVVPTGSFVSNVLARVVAFLKAH